MSNRLTTYAVGTVNMPFQDFFSRLWEKLKRLFVGSKRNQDRRRGEADLIDLRPQPGSGVVARQGGNEADGGQEGVGSVGSPPRPGDPETVSTDEHEREFGRIEIYVDGEDVGSMDPSPRLGGEVSGSRGSQEGNDAAVDGDVGPKDLPLESNPGILSDRGSSGGMWRTSFGSLL